jgi:pimeloyl-ACP methyl ester carboxylesterase
MPALIIRGEYARKPSRLIAETLAARIPEARLVVITGAGHMGPFTHAPEINALIASHVTAVHLRMSPL